MTPEQQAVLMMRGMISQFNEEESKSFKAAELALSVFLNEFKMEHGEAGMVAFQMAVLEMAAAAG